MKTLTDRNWILTFALVLIVAASMTAVACGDDDDDDDDSGDDDDDDDDMMDQAYIRAIHLSPDTPAVDVYVNQSILAVEGLEFPDSSDYAALEPGTYRFDVTPTGSSVDDAALTIDGLALDEDTYYTAVAFDELAAIQALALVDDRSDPGAGNIRVRAIHTAVGVGEVDIWEVSDAENPVALYENVGFGDVGEYAVLPVGTYTLGFDLDDDQVPDVIFEIPELPEGTVANVFAVSDDDGVFLLAQFDGATTARIDPTPQEKRKANIRAIHLSPNAPAVDILIDGAVRAFEDLAFEASTDYAQLDEGTYTFDVVPADGGKADSVLEVADLPLEGDVFYTAVAFDRLTDDGAIQGLAIIDDYTDPGAETVRVRAIHTASLPALSQVDVWEVSDADPDNWIPLYVDFDFGNVGDYYELPSDTSFTLGFDVDNNKTMDAVFVTPPLAEGTVANIFAVNDDSAVFLIAQFDGDATARIDAAPVN